MRTLASFFAATLLTISASAQTYTITDFGPLSGGRLSAATEINSSGVVAGYSTFTPTSATRAVIGTSNSDLTNIGSLPGATASWAMGINDAGTIAGYSIISGKMVAFTYSGGTFTALPTLGGNSATASAINNSGQVTGNASITGNTASHAYRHTNGTMVDLGTFGGANSTGQAINDNGWIVGTSDVSLSSYSTRAFLSRPGYGLISLSLGGSFGAGYGINNLGHAVGQSALLNNDAQRNAFFFNGEGVLNLGTLGGTQATAYGINDSDVIVGSSLTAANDTFYAFIYRNGVMTNLNTLIAPTSGWVLNEAFDINNTGQIVGWGTYNGEQRGFILNVAAIPEPSTYAAIFGGLVLSITLWRRCAAPLKS